MDQALPPLARSSPGSAVNRGAALAQAILDLQAHASDVEAVEHGARDHIAPRGDDKLLPSVTHGGWCAVRGGGGVRGWRCRAAAVKRLI
jgi:hypothetical protein